MIIILKSCTINNWSLIKILIIPELKLSDQLLFTYINWVLNLLYFIFDSFQIIEILSVNSFNFFQFLHENKLFFVNDFLSTTIFFIENFFIFNWSHLYLHFILSFVFFLVKIIFQNINLLFDRIALFSQLLHDLFLGLQLWSIIFYAVFQLFSYKFLFKLNEGWLLSYRSS